MNKATKFLVAILAVGIAAVCVGMGYTAVKNGDNNTTAPVTVEPSVNITTTAPTTTEPTTEKEPELSELLIGKWTDSAAMSGFEFFSNGKVSFTYANLSALGINFDGTIENGTYELKDNKLTIAYSVYSATIDKTYEISIEDDELKMKNTDDGKTSRYIRTDSFEGMEPTQGTSVPDELMGSWENKNIGKSYKFSQNGKVTVTVYGKAYEGVYLTEGTTVMIQYTADGKKNTEKYTFAVTKTTLALTDIDGDTFNFSRMGTSITPSGNSDSLLGVWRDSANLSGYEFKEGEVVSITFVNFKIPVIDVPVNGTFTGGYEVKDGVLYLTYYIYGKKISNSYTFEVSGNTLRLTDTETGNISTYIKQ